MPTTELTIKQPLEVNIREYVKESVTGLDIEQVASLNNCSAFTIKNVLYYGTPVTKANKAAIQGIIKRACDNIDGMTLKKQFLANYL